MQSDADIGGEPSYRTLAELSPLPAILIGRHGRVMWSNRAARALLADGPFWGSLHEVDRGAARYCLERLLDGAVTTWQGEWRFQKPGEVATWMEISAVAVQDGQGETSVLLQCVDIDARKKAHDDLALREARWNHALECAGQGVWDHDFRTETVFFSRMWRQMRGEVTDEPMTGPKSYAWLERVHPADRERLRASIREQEAGNVAYNAVEYRERHRDGHYMWILSRGRPVSWFPDGTPSRILGTDTDITALKLVEEQLAAETELLNVTMRSIAEGVIATDANGVVTFINPAAEAMIGCSDSDAKGRPATELLRLVDQGGGVPVACPVEACLRGKQAVHVDGDVMLVSLSGTQRDVRCSASPLLMADNEIGGAVLLLQDVSASRAHQRQLAHSARHDSLTGLANRGAFEDYLKGALAATRNEQRDHVLCFIDLDHFKQVNDSAGHEAGDALLKEISRVIREHARPGDIAARIGGDEFGLIMPDCTTGLAVATATTIVRAIGAMAFDWEGQVYRPGACVGVTLLRPEDTRAVAMRRADEACYAAKAAGRNAVVTADQLPETTTRRRAVG